MEITCFVTGSIADYNKLFEEANVRFGEYQLKNNKMHWRITVRIPECNIKESPFRYGRVTTIKGLYNKLKKNNHLSINEPSKLVNTNIYRCLNYCPNCPFKDNGKVLKLDKNRVNEIKDKLLSSDLETFNCHKTVYNLDLNMEPVKEHKQPLKMCYGAYKFLLDLGKPNIQMRLHKVIYGEM